MNYVQERSLAPNSFLTPGLFGSQSLTPPQLSLTQPPSDDAISQWQPPFAQGAANPADASGFLGMFQQLFQMLGQFLSQFGFPNGTPPQAGQYFNDAQASSAGDPHLSFSGSGRFGTEQAHFDSMSGHGNLLTSSSLPGGYTLSTQTTAPDANGITYNQCATVTTGYGQTQISLDNKGNANVVSLGRTISLAPGQQYDLGGGASVSRASDGSLTISDRNANGGEITTSMRVNGNGVDVSVQAHHVELSGDLPTAAQPQSAPLPRKPERGADPLRAQFGPALD